MAKIYVPGYYDTTTEVISGGRIWRKKKPGNAIAKPAKRDWFDLGPAPDEPTVPTAPLPIKNLIADTNNSTILIKWDNPTPNMKKRIYVKPASAADTAYVLKLETDVATSTATIPGVNSDAEYDVQVRTFENGLESVAPHPTKRIKTKALPKPPANVTNLVATATTDEITVSWTNPA